MSGRLIAGIRSAALSSLVALPLVGSTPASAGPEAVLVNARCEPAAAPGRVQCEVEVEVSRGRLPWADVVVREVPSFAEPLRSRVGPEQATRPSPRRLRLPLSLVATALGQGQLVLSVRSVHCESAGESESCESAERRVSAEVVVGPRGGSTRW